MREKFGVVWVLNKIEERSKIVPSRAVFQNNFFLDFFGIEF